MLDLQGRRDAPYAQDLLSLDADGVQQLLTDLGYPHYHDQLHEHGITGDVLVHLDHAALKDVGVHSVGQRLAILKTVYDLKVEQNIPIEEGHYVPPSEELSSDYHLQTQQIVGLLAERDDRIRVLEYEVLNLHSALNSLRDESLNLARANSSLKPRPLMRSPTSTSFPHPLSNASTLSRSSSTGSRPRHPPPVNTSSSLALPASMILPDSPNSPVNDSPRLAGDVQQQQQQQQQHPPQHAQQQQQQHQYVQVSDANGQHLHPAEMSINGVSTPTTPTGQMLVPPDASAAAAPHPAGGGLLPATARSGSSPHELLPSSATRLSPSSGDRRQREVSSSGGTTATAASSDNPYRSFRVTVEDPCYKVLPAALKKYKINDDWRLYALFICYGNTERCLAYDEKPLLLFQKLKESNDNPVFMLRHIKDIKSPIAVASAKHSARREKRPPGIGGGTERSLMGVNRDGSATAAATSATATATSPGANGLAPNARPTRLHHPPVLLPVGKAAGGEEGEGADAGAEARAGEDGKGAKSPSLGYCIAIYPYLAEREDEFDVAVGDTFVILSKTKGWWVVHRDQAPGSLSSSTSSNPDHHPAARKSAWVPAGCLLETSVPPLSLLPAGGSPDASAPPGNAASVPIPPALVVSVSTPGVALMDYTPRGSGELDVRKGQPLRILKRYNHWSYAIKEDGGRGWLPSWFCGRANKSGSGQASAAGQGEGAAAVPASSPATPTVSGSGSGPTSAGSTTSSPATGSTPTFSPPPSAAATLAPPILATGGSGAGQNELSPSAAGASSSATPFSTPGQPGLGKPELSVAVSPATLRSGVPLPPSTTATSSSSWSSSSLPSVAGAAGGNLGAGSGANQAGPKSAGPTMQDGGNNSNSGGGGGGGTAHERPSGPSSGLPSSRSADAALTG